jgi:hypothetical protein
MLPQMPQYLLVPIMIMVLGWGICILMLLISFRNYVKRTNALIELLYNQLEQAPNDRDTVQLPTMDMDNVY